MSIQAILSTDLVTVTTGGNLQEAVTKMLDERVGSVVVQDNEKPAGIITETDVLAGGRPSRIRLAKSRSSAR